MRARRWARVALAALVAVGIVWLMLRQVSIQSVVHQVRAAPLSLLALASVAALVFNLARALRYRALLAARGNPSMVRMTGISTTAWAVSLGLPGVFGDAVLVWLLRRTSRVPLTQGAAAALISRAADIASFALIVLLGAPLLGVHLPPAAIVALSLTGAGVVVLTVALLASRPRRALMELAARLPRVRGLTERADHAIAGMSNRSSLAAVLGTTALSRLCSAIEYMALFAALGSPLSFWQTSFAVSIRTLFLAIPIQGMAGFGTTQLWWTTSLVLLGKPLSAALVTGLAVHVLDLAVSAPVAIAGAVLLLLALSSPRRRGNPLRRWAARGWPLIGPGLFTLLRLPSFFEPHWYTDEAGYAATARAVVNGHRIYSEAWTNKPPLHILSVALPFSLFGPNVAALHTLTFLTGLTALLAVIYIGRRMLGTRGAILLSVVFAVAIGLPFFDTQLTVPESLLIAPTTWAGALLFARLVSVDPPSSWWSRWGWAIAVGALTGVALGIQQTVVADSAVFFLAILLSDRTGRRDLVLFVTSLVAVVGVWLCIVVVTAGLERVTFSLVTFFFDYAAHSVPTAAPAMTLKAVAPILALVGVFYARRSPIAFLWLWACLTLEIAAVANRDYPHFLAPAIAPTLLALATLPSLLPQLRLRFAPLGVAVALAASFASVASVDAKALIAYARWPGATISGQQQAWQELFDDRSYPDEDVATWIKDRGLVGSRAVVWSSDAWVYLLADLAVVLPAAPIYNDVVLYGSGSAVVEQVTAIDPDLIVTSDDAISDWPDIEPYLASNYTLAYTSRINKVFIRRHEAQPTLPLAAGSP